MIKNFIFFILLTLGIPLTSWSECQTCKGKSTPPNAIDYFPFVIKKPGRYRLETNLTVPHYDENPAVIVIRADNVTLDLNGKTIDMRNNGMSGIRVAPQKNIRIYNGKIMNTGRPRSIQKFNPSEINGEFVFQNPFGTEPKKGVGIVLESGLENIYIDGVTFENNFIGIAGLDYLKQVSIIKCTGNECGAKYSSNRTGGSNYRGGFVIISPTEDSRKTVSENIKISHCAAHTQVGQFGIAVFHGKSVFIEDCTMHVNETNEELSYPESSAISAIGCQQVHFTNLVGYGGPNCINTYQCSNEHLTNCQAN